MARKKQTKPSALDTLFNMPIVDIEESTLLNFKTILVLMCGHKEATNRKRNLGSLHECTVCILLSELSAKDKKQLGIK